MAARMRGMVSPTCAAGVVRVALRAEPLECVATLYYTHTTHAARAQAETAEVVTVSSTCSIDIDPNFRNKKNSRPSSAHSDLSRVLFSASPVAISER